MKNQWARVVIRSLAVAGAALLALYLLLGPLVSAGLPLVFLMLAAGFVLLSRTLLRDEAWGAFFYIPAGILAALGLVFFINVVTGDWNAWAYAWLLLLAGAGLGTALAGRALPESWPAARPMIFYGVGLAFAAVTFFAVFGAITGGPFIQLMAPILLVLGGFGLYAMRGVIALARGASPAREAVEPGDPPRQHAALAGPAEAVEPLVEPISPREMEVLRLIAQGLTNAEIAARLVLAQSTVKTHINSLYGKLGVQGRVQALKRARELRLL
jgi:DNA-binding CsgD family transcriptional regulator